MWPLVPVNLVSISARSDNFARVEPVQQEHGNLLHASGQVTSSLASIARLRAFAFTLRPTPSQAFTRLTLTCVAMVYLPQEVKRRAVGARAVERYGRLRRSVQRRVLRESQGKLDFSCATVRDFVREGLDGRTIEF
jgi:hypothetical protein